MMSIHVPAIIENQEMNDDTFQQFYQSLTPMGLSDVNTMVDQWWMQDLSQSGFLSPASISSSPEIATPHDIFLNSPHLKEEFDARMTTSACMLNQATAPNGQSVANLFADLPAALAALASAAPSNVPSPTSSPPMPTSTSPAAVFIPQTKPEPISHVASASTPAFSASPAKSRKRSIDPADEAALKRQKNTDAARRSRAKKVMKMETLENRVADLEKENASLLLRVAVLESEKSNFQTKETSNENRIKILEAQLAEAHKALASRSSS
ncbi:uncharacterized protein BYT42DRAFT_576488 [Radiomyces spectabilis]|uniref:uncharacterized protein n=1 Tax=Radiomyces spectabilis TaxID=64574 RepID=UPI00221F1F04|nr:uncharacterized protein BYT42DRAFT_576488 [Radiomyces spectabilis]KAI8374472.1 hypothetical protein BYT42DRAFT_576488 [Radiomyces spectabilis]